MRSREEIEQACCREEDATAEGMTAYRLNVAIEVLLDIRERLEALRLCVIDVETAVE